MKIKVSKNYLDLYIACCDYICNTLSLTRNELNKQIHKIIKTQCLINFYEALESASENKLSTISIENESFFFHHIDHYDNCIFTDQRDITGSYYTPKAIVDYMCQTLIETDEIQERLALKKSFSLLEPACGTMTFLRGLVYTMEKNNFEEKEILLIVNQMVAVDLQAEPLILGILSMIYVSRKSLGQLAEWSVYYGDTLKMKFLYDTVDVVFGNPPYLGEKGNRSFFRTLKEAPETTAYYEKGMDFYYFFIHFALNALKEGGILSFITTNYFTTADGGKKLRKRLQDAGLFQYMTDYSGNGFFRSARGQHNMSFIYKKKNKVDSLSSDICQIANVIQNKKGVLKQLSLKTIEEYKLYDAKGQISLSISSPVYELLEKIRCSCDGDLSDIFDVKQGIVSGGDIVSNRILKMGQSQGVPRVLEGKIKIGEPIFVFPHSATKVFDGPWKDFYKNSDINAYYIDKPPRYMIYYVDEDCLPSLEAMRHLEQYYFMLSQRREVKLGYRNWYELQWPRNKSIFEQPKIVMPQRSKRNIFAYTDKSFYGSADIYYILHKHQDIKSLLYLTGVLNSKLYYFWLYHRGKRKGEQLELYSTPIKNLPLIHYKDLPWQNKIISVVQEIIKNQSRENLEIDLSLYEGFSLSKREIGLIETLYTPNLD